MKQENQPSVTPSSRPLNLRSIQRKTKQMNDPGITIPFGTYMGYTTILAYPMFHASAVQQCGGHDRPQFLSLSEIESNPDRLEVVPALVESDSTVAAHFDPDNKFVSIDFYSIIISRNLTIPTDTNLFIPVTTEGGKLYFHLDKISYKAVERGKRKKNDDSTSTEE